MLEFTYTGTYEANSSDAAIALEPK